MHPKDVKLQKLTCNLMNLTEQVAAYSASEAKRMAQTISEAKQAALSSLEKPTKKRRGRAAVVSWDLGHNPVGRAYVLYQLLQQDWEVDLVGPMWSQYGSQIWGPLKNSDLRVRSFRCSTFSEFMPKAETIAAGKHYDIVYVCKPRLPSLYLGALIKQNSDCPMILDVDDFELSFFKNEHYANVQELKEDLETALHEPFEEMGTRYAQTLVPYADAITVSNVALQKRFGGQIVRHARDEVQFSNTKQRRGNARVKLGIQQSEFALIFIGTPRPHKGVLEVAMALHELNDPTIVFHIVGDITDTILKQKLQDYSNARIVMHPNCEFEELPNLLAGADLVPLIQDVEHPISHYQIPAKISDALSLGVPVVATYTPPLEDLIASGAIHGTDKNTLAKTIASIKQSINEKDQVGAAIRINKERCSFLGELSLTVNRARLGLAIAEAREFCRLDDQLPDMEGSEFPCAVTTQNFQSLPSPMDDMVEIMRSHYIDMHSRNLQTSREKPDSSSKREEKLSIGKSLKRIPSLLRSRSTSYDIAYFWKQNDSNLYGRRSDMIAQELVRSGRVRKMIHFDAPISISTLNQSFNDAVVNDDEQSSLIIKNVVDRKLGIFDDQIVHHRTHVYANRDCETRYLGRPMNSKGSYVRFVNEQLDAHGMRAENTIAWFCPVVWDAPELIEKIGFGGVISDLIDDQRAWDVKASHGKKLDVSYNQTLCASDVVFANCESLANGMQSYVQSKIHVVPNGAERFVRAEKTDVPERLKKIKGPIAGYVGNLKDRIDWALLHEIVPSMPDVSFVFFGPASDIPNANSLAMYQNVHVLGVLPYCELGLYLQHFDVGLVPHLNNRLTASMNPLKVYNYFAAGLPIVSSNVANLETMGGVLKTATSSVEFVDAIRQAIANPIDTHDLQWQTCMEDIAWQARVNRILQVMDQSLHRKLAKSASRRSSSPKLMWA